MTGPSEEHRVAREDHEQAKMDWSDVQIAAEDEAPDGPPGATYREGYTAGYLAGHKAGLEAAAERAQR